MDTEVRYRTPAHRPKKLGETVVMGYGAGEMVVTHVLILSSGPSFVRGPPICRVITPKPATALAMMCRLTAWRTAREPAQ